MIQRPATGSRRLFALIGATVGLLLLPACAVTTPPAATVGTHTLDDGDFTALLSDMTEVDDFASFSVGATSVTGDFARELLTQWISTQALADEIARQGGQVTQADLDEMEETLATQSGLAWDEVPESVRSFFVETFATQEVFAQTAAPDDDALRAIYEQGGQVSGVVCTRHILVATQAEAQEVLAELEGGADFAELAAELSLDTFSGASGGIVEPQAGTDCFTTAELQQAIIPEYVDASLAAEVGVPSEPFQTQFGWHVLLVRPFDEVAEAVRSVVAGSEATLLQQQVITATEARVRSTYGTWVPSLGAVLPVGRLPAPPAAP